MLDFMICGFMHWCCPVRSSSDEQIFQGRDSSEKKIKRKMTKDWFSIKNPLEINPAFLQGAQQGEDKGGLSQPLV